MRMINVKSAAAEPIDLSGLHIRCFRMHCNSRSTDWADADLMQKMKIIDGRSV